MPFRPMLINVGESFMHIERRTRGNVFSGTWTAVRAGCRKHSLDRLLLAESNVL